MLVENLKDERGEHPHDVLDTKQAKSTHVCIFFTLYFNFFLSILLSLYLFLYFFIFFVYHSAPPCLCKKVSLHWSLSRPSHQGHLYALTTCIKPPMYSMYITPLFNNRTMSQSVLKR